MPSASNKLGGCEEVPQSHCNQINLFRSLFTTRKMNKFEFRAFSDASTHLYNWFCQKDKEGRTMVK